MVSTQHNLVPVLRFPEFVNDGEWEEKTIGEILTIGNGRDYKHLSKGDVPVFGTGGYMTAVNDFLYDGETVFIGRKGTIDKPFYYKGKFWTVDTLFYTTSFNEVLPLFVYDVFQNVNWLKYNEASGVPSLSKSTIEKITIAKPSIEEQQKIADCLSSLDKCIQATKDKVESLKESKRGLMQKLFPGRGKTTPEYRFPEFVNDDAWLFDEMQEIFEIKNGYTPSKSNPVFWENGTLPWFRMEDIRKNGHVLSDSIQHITPEAVKGSGLFPAYSIIVATTATIGEHALTIVDSLANQQFTFLTKRKSFENRMDMMYFHYYMFVIDEWCKQNTNSGGLLSVNMAAFKKLSIPYPATIQEQQRIADCLSSLDKQIELYSERVTLLEEYKKGLMQQLFP